MGFKHNEQLKNSCEFEIKGNWIKAVYLKSEKISKIKERFYYNVKFSSFFFKRSAIFALQNEKKR